jgi:broad specificity phosphatase PhoE
VLQVLWLMLKVQIRFLRWRWRLWRRMHGMKEESTQDSMKRTLLIVRHGQTTWNTEHRLPGLLPGVALNETGRKQAARLAEALSVMPISAIISSPLERARDTAAYLAQGRDIPVQIESDLVDTDVGPWAGRVISELSKEDSAWQAYVKDPTTAPEGVETFPHVQQRVVAAIERWLAQDNLGTHPVFVAHADVIKLLLAYYMGLETRRAGSLHIDNASVSLIELDKDQPPHVVALGWNPQPGWLKPPAPPAPATQESTPSNHAQEVGEQKT